MASISHSPTSLEDLVSCSICLENFTDPRALPCVHSYCRECLGRLVTPQGKITCPQCRMEFDVPDNDVSNFIPNFIVNNLLEISNAKNTLVTTSDDQPTCPIHTGRSCELYCEDCSKLICYQCVSKWAECHQHTYRDAKDVVGQLRGILNDFNGAGEQRLQTIKQHLGLLEDLRAKQVANVSEICENIEDKFARHFSTLETRKKQLVEAAVASHQNNVAGLESEFERIQIEMAKVVSTNELCRNMLDIEDHVIFMHKYSNVKDKVFEAGAPELVSEIDIHELKFEEDDTLLGSVLLNYGNVQNIRQGEEAKQNKAIENEEKVCDVQNIKHKSPTGQRVSSGTMPGTSGTGANSAEANSATRPQREEPQNRSLPGKAKNGLATTSGAVVDNTPVDWKLYPKNFTDKWITIEDKGYRVRTQDRKFVAVLGMPGFKTGKHTWKVKVENLGSGIGVGVCLGKDRPALCVTFDSPLTIVQGWSTLIVQLDCEKRIIRVQPEGHQSSSLQYNEQNVEVNPYFVLFPSARNGVLTVIEMDGKIINENASCCIL